MHAERPQSRPQPRIRYGLISIHSFISILYFVLALIHGSFLWVAALVGLVPLLASYIPPAIWFDLKSPRRVYDRAGAEVAYLSLQSTLWFICAVLGMYFNGPSACAEWSYYAGQWSNQNPDSPEIDTTATIIHSCDIDIVLNAFACVHFVFLAGWMWWIIYLVRGLPFERAVAFKCGVGRIMRGEYTERIPVMGKRDDVELGVLSHSGASGETFETSAADHSNTHVESDYSTHSTTATASTSLQTPIDRTNPPALPPRPALIPLAPVITNDMPPPAYEPQHHSADPLSSNTSPTGRTLDFDTFMRTQQIKMEEKLALERGRMDSPSGQTSTAGSSSSNSPWGPLPDTRRRRRGSY